MIAASDWPGVVIIVLFFAVLAFMVWYTRGGRRPE